MQGEYLIWVETAKRKRASFQPRTKNHRRSRRLRGASRSRTTKTAISQRQSAIATAMTTSRYRRGLEAIATCARVARRSIGKKRASPALSTGRFFRSRPIRRGCHAAAFVDKQPSADSFEGCACNRVSSAMVDVPATPQRAKSDNALRTLVLISTAHWVSHFHLLVLPMLFPFLKAQLGVGYIELGFALTVFAVVSGLTQAPMGYVADHIGARKILLAGLTTGGLALVMLGVNLSYPCLIASAVLLGLANSVYHPADYAILAAHMDEERMGRAFSIHTFAGFLGGALAPAIVAALVTVSGGLGALIVAGAVGPLGALLLIALGIPEASAADRQVDGMQQARQSVVTPALMMLTIFFMLLSLSNAGIGNFGVVALMNGYGASFSSANIALTAFLSASAVGVLAGGFLADRTQRHGRLAAACFA